MRQAQQAGALTPSGLPTSPAALSDAATYQMQQAERQDAFGLYTEEHARAPGDWSPSALRKLQTKLVEAGILQSKFHLGTFDAPTQQAYSDLLAMANDNGGKTKDEMLRQLISTAPDDLASFFRKPQFIRPDRDALVNDIEAVFKQRLGRAPTSSERKDLADFYAAQYRREYRLETVPQAQEAFVGQAANSLTGAELTLAGGDPYAAAGFSGQPREAQEVDPGAAVAREFSKRFKNEENMLARREEQDEMSVTATNAFGQLRSMMAGGGVQQLG